jgi:alpha-glucuronidase
MYQNSYFHLWLQYVEVQSTIAGKYDNAATLAAAAQSPIRDSASGK